MVFVVCECVLNFLPQFFIWFWVMRVSSHNWNGEHVKKISKLWRGVSSCSAHTIISRGMEWLVRNWSKKKARQRNSFTNFISEPYFILVVVECWTALRLGVCFYIYPVSFVYPHMHRSLEAIFQQLCNQLFFFSFGFPF